MDTPISNFLARLESLTGFAARRNGRGWITRCPVHADNHPSLSVSEGRDGRVLVKCFAGCPTEQVVAAASLTMRDLMPVDAPTVDRTRNEGCPRGVPSTSTRQRRFGSAGEATAALERKLGPATASWPYHNTAGEHVGSTIRWDHADGGKEFRPVSQKAGRWVIGAMACPRPLYALPTLANARRIYVCEGEKAAEALRKLGLVATTSPNGAKSADKTAWSPLAGKEVVILPDADRAGRGYADEVTRFLTGVRPAPTTKVVELPDLPEGGDAVEFIASRREAGLLDDAIRLEIEALADAAEPVQMPNTPPAILRYEPFPVGVLPEPIQSFVRAGAEAIVCSASFIVLPLLAALAAAVGGTRRIQLKRGWTEPCIVWTGVVGDSGTAKTPAFRLVTKSIEELQAKRFGEYEEVCKRYDDDFLEYEVALTAWKRAAVADRDKAGDPPERPEQPEAVRYLLSDATIEALIPIVQVNQRLLLARDELAGWIRSFDQYKGGRGGDAQQWLSIHFGGSITVDRKTGPQRTIYVPAAFVSVTGGIQLEILARVIGHEHRESGMLARLLFAMPPRRPKRWTETEVPEHLEAQLRTLFEDLYAFRPEYTDEGEPCPKVLPVTPQAKHVFADFVNAHADEQIELTGDLSKAWSKLEGYAARLALVVHCVRVAASDPRLADADVIDIASVRAGITLSRWFAREARRVHAALGESEQEGEQRQLVELTERKGGAITVREVMRSSRMFTKSADAEAALDELVGEKIGRWEYLPLGPQGGQPSRRFVLAGSHRTSADTSPSADGVEAVDVDTTPACDHAKGGSVNVNGVNTPTDGPSVNSPSTAEADSASEDQGDRERFEL